MNDAVLAIIGGALRRYLQAKKDLPTKSLVAMSPVNTRQDAGERQTSGNTISLITFGLGTDIAAPLERLAAVHAGTAQTKAVQQAVGARDLTDISRFAPPATLALAGRLVILTGFGGGGPMPLHNCVVSNVPGPVQPLVPPGCQARLLFRRGSVDGWRRAVLRGIELLRSAVHRPDQLAEPASRSGIPGQVSERFLRRDEAGRRKGIRQAFVGQAPGREAQWTAARRYRHGIGGHVRLNRTRTGPPFDVHRVSSVLSLTGSASARRAAASRDAANTRARAMRGGLN